MYLPKPDLKAGPQKVATKKQDSKISLKQYLIEKNAATEMF